MYLALLASQLQKHEQRPWIDFGFLNSAFMIYIHF